MYKNNPNALEELKEQGSIIKKIVQVIPKEKCTCLSI
jgi:hypothetical protein